MPNLAILPTLLRELMGSRLLQREPEPEIMDCEAQVADFVSAGREPGLMAAAYLFHSARICQVIEGCRSVLDLGCGPGTQLVQIAKLNPEISFVGVDLSETMLEAARIHAVEQRCQNIEFRRMDISRLHGFEDNSFDGVISTMTLHHLPTRDGLRSCLYEVNRVLRPGGALYLVDFGLLKSLASIMFLVDANRPHQKALFSRDFELSLRAAFLAEDFRALSQEIFSDNVKFYGTFPLPILNAVKTADRPLKASLLGHFRRKRAELASVYRSQLDDMRTFFWLGGLRHDPFSNLGSRASQMPARAYLRQRTIADQ